MEYVESIDIKKYVSFPSIFKNEYTRKLYAHKEFE